LTIVGVRRFGWPRLEYYKFEGPSIEIGTACLVEQEHGLDFGEVIVDALPQEWAERFSSAGKIVRVAEEKDLQVFEQKIVLERQAYDLCLKKNEDLRIPMKLVRVVYSYDLKKAIFFYTATGRIDFRLLVKELARTLRIRVEMRQIGVRDEAKMLPGCGTCGITLCCSTFLQDFAPVSMKMAKHQNLVLNPSKVSGVCGRLKCCLAYEYHPGEKKKASCIIEYDDVN